MFTYDESIVSDLHKDARGFRPSADFWSMWNEVLPAGKQLIWDNLLRDFDADQAREKREHQLAIHNFENEVADCLALGAKNRKTAIKWIVQSLNLSQTDLMYGGSFVCHMIGLPYTMEGEFNEVCKELQGQLESA